MSIDLLKKEVFIKMVYFILFLLLANITGIVFKFYVGHDYIYGLVPLFDFDAEKNIPTLYSSFAIIIASMFLAVIAFTNFSKVLTPLMPAPKCPPPILSVQ